MKRSYIIIGVVVLVLIIAYSSIKGTYNSMNRMNEDVKSKWSQVENVYQRRADLIPNLVEVVKGYASHERETLEGVIEARSKATSTTINANNLNAETMKNFNSAQQGLSSALSKLMVVVERYPDLKANQNFLELQAQLEGSENRITVERQKFNESTQVYNTYIQNFPKNLYANLFNFDSKPYFEADAGSQEVPKVEF